MQEIIEEDILDFSYMKVCIFGDSGTGKSSIAKQLNGEVQVVGQYEPTNYVEIYERIMKGDRGKSTMDGFDQLRIQYTLQINDYGGDETSKNFGIGNCIGADIIILVYNCMKPETVESLFNIFDKVIINVMNHRVQFMLIGTHYTNNISINNNNQQLISQLESKIKNMITQQCYKQCIDTRNNDDIKILETELFRVIRNIQRDYFIKYSEAQTQQKQNKVNSGWVQENAENSVVDKTMIKYQDIRMTKAIGDTGKGECIYQNEEYEVYQIVIEPNIQQNQSGNQVAYESLFNNFTELLINLSLNHEYILKPTHYCFEQRQQQKNPQENFVEINICMIFNEIPYTFEDVQNTNSMQQQIEFMIKLGEGLAYCHSKNILHLDLKPSNILADKKNNEFIPKIIDFGISKVLKTSEYTISQHKQNQTKTLMLGQTKRYSSPEQQEVFEIQQFTQEVNSITKTSDVYSYTLLLMYMVTKQKPWPLCPHENAITPDIKKNEFLKQHSQLLDKIKIKNLKGIIIQGVHPNPAQRPHLESLIKSLKDILLSTF